ncbi:MAG: FMN-binding protein [Planctomycetota bacterium]
MFAGHHLKTAALAILLTCCGAISAEDDVVEFLNGTKLTGTITSIRKTDREFDFETKVGARTLQRVYPFSKVHAVVYNGERYELTPKSAGKLSPDDQRTEREVLALIESSGKTPPDWFESTKLNYPKTLDLAWPLKAPPGGWNTRKNVGQFIWSVVNENPPRWRSGVKLVHHLVSLHQGEPALLSRDMNQLGKMYFELLQDYERAAYWYQRGEPTMGTPNGVHLAECYWRLGNREMALDLMRGKSLNVAAIKLLGDMGEIEWSLRLTKAFAKSRASYQANILAGDALRQAGRLDEAIAAYQKVVDADTYRNAEYKARFVGRARESIETIRLFDQADVTKVADGIHRGYSTGYNGQLDVEARVQGGRLQSVEITKHKEKQFYSALTDTPAQLVEQQGVENIDATSGATITSQAIVNATARALAEGSK